MKPLRSKVELYSKGLKANTQSTDRYQSLLLGESHSAHLFLLQRSSPSQRTRIHCLSSQDVYEDIVFIDIKAQSSSFHEEEAEAPFTLDAAVENRAFVVGFWLVLRSSGVSDLYIEPQTELLKRLADLQSIGSEVGSSGRTTHRQVQQIILILPSDTIAGR